ncbi:MAG TPA: PhoU domain-containing protein [Chloroflexota bacterium]|nr:PhoU domain-containing protein [Chloroflexota bacterium]
MPGDASQLPYLWRHYRCFSCTTGTSRWTSYRRAQALRPCGTRSDPEAARAIMAEDDQVDALYDQIYRELLTYMIEDPKLIQRATWLLWAAHNVERIADRATNVCERVVNMVTGQIEEMESSKY